MNANNLSVSSRALMVRHPSLDHKYFVVRRSIPVRALKRVLTSARAAAPTWLYNAFYRVGFAGWKGALRLLYGRKVLVAWLRADHQRLQMHRTVHQAMRFSLVGTSGLEATYKAVVEILHDNIAGCIVECGVAEGGCSALMATVVANQNSERTTWLFDSFEGLPDPTEKDFVDPGGRLTGENVRPLERGSCLGSLNKVQRVLFREFALNRTKVELVKGWFQDTLPAYRDKLGPIAMLRIDGDWYESTKCCLDNLFDRIVPGGYCIADDYGTFYGCRRAMDEFIQSRNLNIQALSDGRGGFLFRKPAESRMDLELTSYHNVETSL
jgi:O-methyltransferase